MTKYEIHKNFIHCMEQTRMSLGYTTADMANALHLTDSTYKNIIYEKSNMIDIDIACRLFDLNKMWMWQMTGYKTSGTDVLDVYSQLTADEKEFIYAIARLIIERH